MEITNSSTTYIIQYTRHTMLIEANDPRGINVAVLSRYRINSVTSHQEIEKDIRYPDGTIRRERVFRRDCLEVDIKKDNRILTLFVCHFKSMTEGREETRHIREVEAAIVKEIIEERFTDPLNNNWIIAGDLNDYIETDGTPDNNHGLHPILDNDFSFNLVKKINEPTNRWTHYYQADTSYHQLDYLLLSPSLRDKTKGPYLILSEQVNRIE
jgi:endonuclease/exonuclease/phosphatase family metal-dependent hydrolase